MNCPDCGVEITEQNNGRYYPEKCKDCDLKRRKYMAKMFSEPGKRVLVDLEL